MRLPIVLVILRKELVETLRDRRTLLLMIGLPVLVYPLLMMSLSRLQEAQQEASQARASVVAVWGTVPEDLRNTLSAADAHVGVSPWLGAPEDVRQAIEGGKATPAPPVEESTPRQERDRRQVQDAAHEQENPVGAAARTLLTQRNADAVIVVWPGFSDAMSADGLGTTTLYFDSVRDDSRLARDRINDALSGYRKGVLAERERTRGLPAGFTDAIDVLRRDVAPTARRAGYILGAFLPFLLVSLSLFGGFYAAVDLTAGEKERGTMQTLMCAPLRSTEIVVGKFLAVWAVALVAAFANVTSLALTISRILPGDGFSVAPGSIALAALMLVPITMTTSALFLAIAAFAKDFKDGQNFLTPVYMLLVMPAGVTMLPSIELDPWTAFVPVVNIALLVKALFAGEVRTDLLFLVAISSAMYAVLAIALAARVFGREQILLGGRESARSVLGLERRAGGVPSPSAALTTFAVALVLAFYASLAIERQGLLTMLVVTQYGFFLVPALAVVFGLGYSARETLSLRWPSWQAAAAAVLVGLTAWLAVAGFVMRIAPPPDALVKALERLLMLGDQPMPLWVVLLAVAVTPAICEELFFRGVILSGLRGLGQWPAIAISSLLFAVAHASIYRLLPTLVLGIVLGYLVWKTRSIVTSMVVHALNNGLAAWMTQAPDTVRAFGLDPSSKVLPLGPTLAATAVCAVALMWVARTEGRERMVTP
jgi:sodium transport system permease protein